MFGSKSPFGRLGVTVGLIAFGVTLGTACNVAPARPTPTPGLAGTFPTRTPAATPTPAGPTPTVNPALGPTETPRIGLPMPTAPAVFTPTLPDLALREGTPYSLRQVHDVVRAQGVNLDIRTLESRAPYFSVAASSFFADGEQVLVWLHKDSASREADSSKIAPDGSAIGGLPTRWTQKVNFFAKGNVILQFVSDNADTAAKLKAAVDALP